MKETLQPTPKDLTLDQINQRFATDEKAREYWESIHWPDGPICPHCKNTDAKRIWKVTPNEKKKIRAGMYHVRRMQQTIYGHHRHDFRGQPYSAPQMAHRLVSDLQFQKGN